MEQINITPSEAAIKHFEFPEIHKSANGSSSTRLPKIEHIHENIVKTFEPKTASTPTLKNEKIDTYESEPSFAKLVNTSDYNKTSIESKISPTNSVVRAMIYTSKNKGGNKKKNTLVASKYLFYCKPLISQILFHRKEKSYCERFSPCRYSRLFISKTEGSSKLPVGKKVVCIIW